MYKEIRYSIIVPQRGALLLLPSLLNSIPQRDDIEIIIVDNTPVPIKDTDIQTDRKFNLLWSSPERHAGGARNVGIEAASGKWLIFADADDYFADNAFQIFDMHFDSISDVIFFCAEGIYIDTGKYSDRAEKYRKLVSDYLSDINCETSIRLGYSVPWAKMIRRSFVDKLNIRFDEIKAGNDIYFSTVAGFMAKKIEAHNDCVYFVTVNRGSLTRRRDYEVTKARLYSLLHCNQFLRSHKLNKFQHSIMFAIVDSTRYGFKAFCEFLAMLFIFRQNPFINYKNWIKTFKSRNMIDKVERRYLIK